MAKVEKSTGKKFGDTERPLLVSVRSGARDSMPGMMDTILNLGMNDQVVEIVAQKTNNARFAWDSYRGSRKFTGTGALVVQKGPAENIDQLKPSTSNQRMNAKVNQASPA